MFEVSWSELLILGLVTLILVGPKELPRFLNTLGRYLGVIRRQANEFRAVFEEAMREAEMDRIKSEMSQIGDGVKASIDEATRSIDDVKDAVRVGADPKAARPALAEKPGAAAGKARAPEAAADAGPAPKAKDAPAAKDAPPSDAPAPAERTAEPAKGSP